MPEICPWKQPIAETHAYRPRTALFPEQNSALSPSLNSTFSSPPSQANPLALSRPLYKANKPRLKAPIASQKGKARQATIVCEGENEPINPADSKSFANLKECLVDIKCWMTQNLLCSFTKIPGLCCLAPSKIRERKEEKGDREGDNLLEANATTANFKSLSISHFSTVFAWRDVFVTEFKHACKTQTRTNSYWTATLNNLSQTYAPPSNALPTTASTVQSSVESAGAFLHLKAHHTVSSIKCCWY